jgi:hypothetical protein
MRCVLDALDLALSFKCCTRRVNAVDLSGALSTKLVKLRIKRLPGGTDAGVSDEPGFRGSFGHIFRN